MTIQDALKHGGPVRRREWSNYRFIKLNDEGNILIRVNQNGPRLEEEAFTPFLPELLADDWETCGPSPDYLRGVAEERERILKMLKMLEERANEARRWDVAGAPHLAQIYVAVAVGLETLAEQIRDTQ